MIFDQLRIGKDGRRFRLYKYRSMVLNADYKLEKYLEANEEARKEYRETKKLKHDPRITKVGAFIRKTSIDEFPQFINVLRGEMSIVGPRPYLPKEKEEMGEAYETIIKMKPGLTGYWQTNGRSNVTFNDRVKMDVKYYKDRSFKTDIMLFVKTFSHLVKNEGAM
ncbi:UDP-glucose:undecaprenyl-phosphate glucose-1-phosphate transferase [compost metagenome]